MNRQRRKELKGLRITKRLLIKHLKRLTQEKDNIPKDVFDASKFLLEQLITHYNSFILLYKKKHNESSLVLARTLLEYSVSLKFLYEKDTEKRSKNFLRYPLLFLVSNLKDNTLPNDFEYRDDLIQFMESEIKDYDPEGKNKFHWSGKTLKEVFDDIKMSETYKLGYQRLSKFSHPIFKNQIDFDGDTPYPNFLRKFIISDLLVIILSGLKLINEKYDLLVGYVSIKDYPEEGTDFFFSFNNKEYK